MKLEKQVCTESQARILQDLGIVYSGYQFAYVDFGVPSGQQTVLCRPATDSEQVHEKLSWYLVGKYSKEIQAELDEGSLGADGGVYPAFTVAELGQMLPHVIVLSLDLDLPKEERKDYYRYGVWKFYEDKDDFWSWRLPIQPINEQDNPRTFRSEAEARADLLIYLIENNRTTAQKVNNRLI